MIDQIVDQKKFFLLFKQLDVSVESNKYGVICKYCCNKLYIFVVPSHLIYNNIQHNMIKTSLFIILAFLLFQCSSAPTVNLVGAPKVISNYYSPQFQTILKFIHKERPELANSVIAYAQMQVVSGINFYVSFWTKPQCFVNVTVNVPADGKLILTSYTSPPCNYGNQQLIVQSNPSGKQFQAALKSALADNPWCQRSDLVATQLITNSGGNYKFIFRNSFQPSDFPKPEQYQQDVFLVGGIRDDITNKPAQYATALNAIYAQHPQVVGYRIVGVQMGYTPALSSFLIGLQNNTASNIRYANFQVDLDNSGNAKITLFSWVRVTKKEFDQVKVGNTNSLKIYPQLKGYTLRRITNIWPSEGLALTYQQGNQTHDVYIYNLKGKVQNFFI